MNTVRFKVSGIARPQGSKVWGKTKRGRMYMREANKHVHLWRDAVAEKAEQAMQGRLKWRGAVKADLRFYFTRPRSHFKRDESLKSDSPVRPCTRYRGDIDKLSRAVLDALTGVLYHDDAQVIDLHAFKFFDVNNYAVIQVWFV